jgi:hypothetical protein
MDSSHFEKDLPHTTVPQIQDSASMQFKKPTTSQDKQSVALMQSQIESSDYSGCSTLKGGEGNCDLAP